MKNKLNILLVIVAIVVTGCKSEVKSDNEVASGPRAYIKVTESVTTTPQSEITEDLIVTPDNVSSSETKTENSSYGDEITNTPTPIQNNVGNKVTVTFVPTSTPTNTNTPIPTNTSTPAPTNTLQNGNEGNVISGNKMTATPLPTKKPTKITKEPTVTPKPVQSNMKEYYPTDELGKTINEYRVSVGATQVKTTDLLNEIAEKRLAELHITGLSHYRPDGSVGFSLLEQNGIIRRYGGEILHSSYDLTATDALYGWSHSSQHNAILSDSKYMLMGCAYDDTYAVAIFVTLMN